MEDFRAVLDECGFRDLGFVGGGSSHGVMGIRMALHYGRDWIGQLLQWIG